MAIFNMGKYSDPHKASKGYYCDVEMLKGSKSTGIKFRVDGTSKQNAVNLAHDEARRRCPDDDD